MDSDSKEVTISPIKKFWKKLLKLELDAVAIVAVVAIVGGFLVFQVSAEDFTPTTSDKPYARLFTELNNAGEARAANNESSINDLRDWYVHVHSEASDPNNFVLGDKSKNGENDTTLAEKLSTFGIWSSQYRNGSYVSQATSNVSLFDEANNLEKNAPLAIGTFWPGNFEPYNVGNNNSSQGRLSQSISANETLVRVTAVTSRPSGTPNTWPFINSKDSNGDGYSNSTSDYVSWIRIGNEMMRITGNPSYTNGVVSIPVQRGFFNTTRSPHQSNTRVQSPVYIGSRSAVPADQTLSGNPSVDNPNKALRYSIKLWRNDGQVWIADQIKRSFGEDLQGYDTIHLDVSSCVQYNNSDWQGNPVWNWQEVNSQKTQRNTWGEAQKSKLATLRQELPGVKFTGNSLNAITAANDNSCNDDLIQSYDGAMLENWLKPVSSSQPQGTDFEVAMQQHFKIQRNNWPGVYWVRWNYGFDGNVDQYKRHSYGSLLLGLNEDNNNYQFGGLWGAGRPDNLFFIDWGQPLTSPDYLQQTAVDGVNDLYERHYENGVVVVNGGDYTRQYTLDKTYFSINIDGSYTKVTDSITVGANDAVFLVADKSSPVPEPLPEVLAPTNLEAQVGDGIVEIAWEDENTLGSMQYEVSYGESQIGEFAFVEVTEELSFTINDLMNDKSYDIRVRALHTTPGNDEVFSDYSDVVSATPTAPEPEPEPEPDPDPVPVLKPPKDINAEAGDETITLTWSEDNPQGTVESYVISYRKVGDSKWMWPGKTTELSFSVPRSWEDPLENGTEYELRVRSRGYDGKVSTDSTPVTVTPEAPVVELYEITQEVTHQWNGGSCVTVNVKNISQETQDWVVDIEVDAIIQNLWNGTYEQNGQTATVQGNTWNNLLEADETTSFNFCQRS